MSRIYLEPTYKASQPMNPRTDTYKKPDNRVEYQLFSNEYFSAADVKLYFGDIWVDDIIFLNFTLQEQVLPIYGYNSYTYEVAPRGTRIVQGSLGMNFTSVGYLQEILKNADAIQKAIDDGKNSGTLPAYYKEMSLDEVLEQLGKRSFEQIADEYEQALWGEKESSSYLSSDDDSWFPQSLTGFDIRVHYGPVAETVGDSRNRFYKKGKVREPNLTVETINGVQITSMTKQGIATSAQGVPITDEYQFIAKDLNGKRKINPF